MVIFLLSPSNLVPDFNREELQRQQIRGKQISFLDRGCDGVPVLPL